jgi:hypothetical protein
MIYQPKLDRDTECEKYIADFAYVIAKISGNKPLKILAPGLTAEDVARRIVNSNK